ncbi:MAG: fibronectin type III domain-containing protein [Opitutales bacterium]|nr:fibronectin type III domain-containing protein [Opitutales bacterium]
MKKRQRLLHICSALALTAFAASAQDYNVLSSSYLGGPGDNDELTSAAIQSDGTLVLAGNLSFDAYAGVTPVYLDGADPDSMATIVRLSTDGQSVVSVTKLTEDMRFVDLALDGLDNIYVTVERRGDTHATSVGKVMKLNPAADTILFENADARWLQVDAGEQGFFAVVGDPGMDFGQPHRVRLYDPDGHLLFERYYPQRGLRDVAVSEEHRMLIVAGFNIEWLGVGEYHLPFYKAFGFNGALRYTGYDPQLKDRIAINPWNMARPYSTAIGQDGELYLFPTYTGQAYENPLFFDPFDTGLRRDPVGGDRYHTPEALAWQDTRKKFAFGRYGVEDGALDRWQVFAGIMGGSGSSVQYEHPGRQAVGPDGRLYFAGGASTGFPIPPEIECAPGTQCFNPLGTSYTGGATMFFMSADMGTRLYAAKFSEGRFNAIAVRRINGAEVIVAAGRTGGSVGHYIHNPLQPEKASSRDGYFAIINAPGPAELPAAPSGLTLTSASAVGNLLEWESHSQNEDGFVVERSVNGGPFEAVARTFPGRTAFRDMRLEAGNAYEYRVAAFNHTGLSAYTAVVASAALTPEPPDAPTNVTARALTATQVRFAWTPVGGSVSGYLLEGQAENEPSFQSLADLAPEADAHLVTGLQAGMPYSFRVRAYNEDGASEPSLVAEATTHPLALEPAADPEDVEPGLCYALYRRTGNFSWWGNFADPGEMVFERDGKVANMDPLMQAVPDFDPRDGHFAFIYSGYIEVPEDGVYRFEYLANKHGMLFINDRVVIDNSTWTWSAWPERGEIGLKAGKHRFVCQFIHGYPRGQLPVLELRISGPGMSWQIVPDGMLYRPMDCSPVYGPPPAAPTNLTVTELAGNVVRVEWDGDPGMEGLHTLELTPVGWSTYDRFKEIQRIAAEKTSYVFINIEPDTFYEVRVRSLSVAGYSPYSPIATFTTASPATDLPAPADRLEAGLISSNEIGLRWRDNASNESHFVIEARSGEGEFEEILTVGRNTTEVLIEDLSPGVAHTFRVGAANDAGILEFSNEIQVATLGGGLPPPSVRAAPPAHGEGLILSFRTRPGALYQVQSSTALNDEAAWADWGKSRTGDGNDLHIEVETPEANPVFYRIRVTEP